MASETRERKTIFVVGLGMVGIAFIEKIFDLDTEKRYKIVTCGEEVHLAYNRVALTDYFQHRNVEKLYLNQADWYAQQDPERFVFHIGETVTSIDTKGHTVTTDKARTVTYDYCVLATGSEAILPSYVDHSIKGIFVYRNIGDLNNLLEYSTRSEVKNTPAVVIGGGLLGLEAAKALYDLETVKDVTIIHRQTYPLSRQLDAAGGEIVLRRIEALGVHVVGDASPRSLVTHTQTGNQIMAGVELNDGSVIPCTVAVFSIGIQPRDELAAASGIACESTVSPGKHGIIVDEYLRTSADDIYAIGECASWNGKTYGLIAPGIEMADILSFNLTQTRTDVGGFLARKMNNPDLSTKLKLVGVDVASFGDYFADNRRSTHNTTSQRAVIKPSPATSAPLSHNQRDPFKPKIWEFAEDKSPASGSLITTTKSFDNARSATKDTNSASSSHKRHSHGAATEGPVETLTYRDPFSGVYKKYIFSADGKYILGGMMVGDTSDYVKLLALVKKKKALEVPPSKFIVGSGNSDDSGADLDDDTQICSCHNVNKGQIVACVRNGATTLADIKTKTKAGTGCGGCVPLVTNIFKAEMAKAGYEVNNNLCPHFSMSRAELFNVVKIKNLRTFANVISAVGVNKDSVGCEICKPAIGSILASLWNEHIMNPVHHANQDTNDRFMANIQRNGTFSVIPRIAAGEITPDKLIILGQVAKKCEPRIHAHNSKGTVKRLPDGLYTKITGGQRIDMFGAQKADLPSIWKELVDAGFESGHAYGKALRTVKSCVGTTWCRYGIGDSVAMAIRLEERYKGIRSPHKLKGGVSGCVRECAEAQAKDFGLIATDKGWNIFICGNGGASPRHATLFATDVPPSYAVRIIDRFIMYYIRTADKLMRTAHWVEQMEGGIERLKKILLEDELGICADLEREMDNLVGTYRDEWSIVANDPERQKQFRQFVNTDERVVPVEQISERGQSRPASWPKTSPAVHLRENQIRTSKDQWEWRKLAGIADLTPTDAGTTSAAVKYGGSQLAIFHVPRRGYFATQQMCPHKRAFVLEHGIIGDDLSNDTLYISCPMHKRNFSLKSGNCLNDPNYSILTFDVKEDVDTGDILVLLPDPDDLDAVIATSAWVIRRHDTVAALDAAIEIVGPGGSRVDKSSVDTASSEAVCVGGVCGDKTLDW